MVNITDPLFRALYNKISEEIENRVSSLAGGAALIPANGLGLDAITTAIKYQEQVSYIAALQFVIEIGLELDRDKYGVRD